MRPEENYIYKVMTNFNQFSIITARHKKILRSSTKGMAHRDEFWKTFLRLKDFVNKTSKNVIEIKQMI